MGHREDRYTTESIFNHFNVSKDEVSVRKSGQRHATVLIIRKCMQSMEIVDEWVNTAIHHTSLFTDLHNDESKAINLDFVENRHDQSVLSVISKLNRYRSQVAVIKDEVGGRVRNRPDVPFHGRIYHHYDLTDQHIQLYNQMFANSTL